jgi:putative transcriptional regulator
MTPPREQQEEFEARAALYALGALADDEARDLAGPLAELPDEVRDFEAVVASLALAAPAAVPAPTVRAELLSRIGNGANPRHAERRAPPSAAPPAINVRFGEIEWEPVCDGVFCKTLYFDREKQLATSLVKLLPGTRLPRHRHFGVEQCLVLEGDFRVGEQVYGPGDFQCVFEGSVHDSISSETGALALIIAPPDYRMAG